jgi:hypothetical protein
MRLIEWEASEDGMICGNLQYFRWVSQSVNFIQNNSLTLQSVPKAFGILHRPADPWQLTIKVLNVRNCLALACFPDTANAGNP